MKTFLISLTILNYISFGWAFVFFFKRAEIPNKKMLGIVSVLGVGIPVMSVITLSETAIVLNYQSMISLVLLLASLGLFWWTISSVRKNPFHLVYAKDAPHTLKTDGPYHFIRHPFYASYSMSWISAIIVAPQIYLVVAVLFLLGLYFHASGFEEKKFESSDFAEAYKKYKNQTGRFFPKISSLISYLVRGHRPF